MQHVICHSHQRHACVKIILVWVKCLAKHTLFLLQFGLVCVQILGVELTRVSLQYKSRVSTTLHAALGWFTQEQFFEAKYTHKQKNLLSFTIIYGVLLLFCVH